MTRTLATLALATLLAGVPAWVARADDPPVPSPNPVEPGRTPTDNTDVDNTGRNIRDRGGETLTPLDQGNSGSDLRITQSIRKAIVADDALSMDAKNVKVITSEGIVTLRGPVASEAERARIESLARGMSDVRRVDSQLEVEAPAATR